MNRDRTHGHPLLRWVAAGASWEAEWQPQRNRWRLTHVNRMRWLAAVGLILCGTMMVVGGLFGDRAATLGLIGFGAFTVLNLYLLWEVCREKPSFDDEAVYLPRFGGASRRVVWDDFTEVVLGKISREMILRTPAGTKVRLDVFLNGLGTFLACARRRAHPEVSAKLEQLLRNQFSLWGRELVL